MSTEYHLITVTLTSDFRALPQPSGL